MKIYKEFFIDAIKWYRINNAYNEKKPTIPYVCISALEGTLCAVLFLFFQNSLNALNTFHFLNLIEFIPNEISGPILMLVFFMGPFFLFNYLFFIRNERYKILENKYEYKNGRIFKNGITLLLILIACILVSLLIVY